MPENSASEPKGPDLKFGIPIESLAENTPFPGRFGDEQVILVRQGVNIFCIGATCTHYGGPLAEGLVVGETIRCPWHHARFSLRTGEAEAAPALNPVSCFAVEQQGGSIRVIGKQDVSFHLDYPNKPDSVVIIGAGASGAACADMLRTKGYAGPVMLVADEDPSPVDRPNLSKDYLAGHAPEDWTLLRTPDYYKSIDVDFARSDPAVRIDTGAHAVTLKTGRRLRYGALLIAPGAEPRTLPIEGAELPHVHRLRTLADSKAIIAAAESSKRCVIIGCSFIGLEVAASLRERGVDVTVIGNEQLPLATVLGAELGKLVRDIHQQHGVTFVLGSTAKAIRPDGIELSSGQTIEAEFVVLGVGVTPRTALAEDAGLAIDNGIVVDETLRASIPDIYAAGDVAYYPDPISGERARIEHWVLAERQGQAVARAMLGLGGPFRDVPFFWSQHYDITISYVGHAASWDEIELHGDLAGRDVCAVYRRNRKALAIATINRDKLSLIAEAALESGDTEALESALRE